MAFIRFHARACHAAWGQVLLGIAVLLQAAHVQAGEASVRDQEIQQCLPGELSSWGDGVDRPAIGARLQFVYRHAAAPAWFTQAQVLAAVTQAAQAWSRCDVPSSVALWDGRASLPKDAILVQWNDAASQGNFGLANWGDRTISLGSAPFQVLKTRNPGHDAQQTLQMVVSHEMGHLFGLMAHSRRCVDVMSYYHDGKGGQCHARDRSQLRSVPEYRSALPTACDIQRCRTANQSMLSAFLGAFKR